MVFQLRRHRQFPSEPAVNRLVAGSNPARGAKFFKDLAKALRGYFMPGETWVRTLRGQEKPTECKV